MNNSDYNPLSAHRNATKSRPPIEKKEVLMTKDNQTEIEITDIPVNPTSLVFVNGILISKQEYSILENMLTLVNPVNTNDIVTIVK